VRADEAARRFEGLLSAELSPPLRADGLIGLIQASGRLGDYDRAWALAEERYELYRSLGDDVGMHRAMQNLATIAGERGEFERARELIEPVISWARGVSDWELTYPLQTLSAIEFIEGNYTAALDLDMEALVIYERSRTTSDSPAHAGRSRALISSPETSITRSPGSAGAFRLWSEIGDTVVVVMELDAVALVPACLATRGGGLAARSCRRSPRRSRGGAEPVRGAVLRSGRRDIRSKRLVKTRLRLRMPRAAR
jgi:tetratricopeptide (TPR) repeat protein